jgi:peroxiredoxin
MKTIQVFALLLYSSITLLAQSTPKAGDKAPNFIAKDQTGQTVELKKLLRKGPVAVVFYRGYWCPNCTRALKSIQDSLSWLAARQLSVVAISPESAEGVTKTIRNTKASFPIISDEGLKIIRSYGLGFAVTHEMDAVHKKYNIDVVGNNGKNGNNLTHPAAFVIKSNGVIQYAYVNSDSYSSPLSNTRVTVAQLLAHTSTSDRQ